MERMWINPISICKNSKLISTYAVAITKKSIIFHAFRRYEFSCSIRPNAIILHVASTQKMTRNIGSVSSNLTARVVRSPSGKCCSDAITRQLAMIVTRIAYSNGGHSIINRISFRNGWSSANKNNDVGPAGLATAIGGIISIFTFADADVELFGADAVWDWSCPANLSKQTRRRTKRNFCFYFHVISADTFIFKLFNGSINQRAMSHTTMNLCMTYRKYSIFTWSNKAKHKFLSDGKHQLLFFFFTMHVWRRLTNTIQ